MAGFSERSQCKIGVSWGEEARYTSGVNRGGMRGGAEMYRVEIIFGHSRQDGQLLPAHQIAVAEQRALWALSHAFRGGQLQHYTGGYLTAEGRLVIEPCSVVWAYALEVERNLAVLWAVAGEIAAALEQESVLLVIERVDGMAHWVGPTQPLPMAVERWRPVGIG